MEKNEIRCSFCQSDKVRKIAYGLIEFKSEEAQKKFREKYVLGGCMIGDDNPAFHCDNCKKDFGKISDLRKENNRDVK